MNTFAFFRLSFGAIAVLSCMAFYLPIGEKMPEKPSTLALNCPADITIHPAVGECDAFLDYDSLLWSSTVPLVDTVFSPAPGFAFEFGETVVSLIVTDINGNTDTCNFVVNVEPIVDFVVCDDNVQVQIDSTCSKIINPFLVLEGILHCEEAYTLNILKPNGTLGGDLVTLDDVGKTLTVRVTNMISGFYCWGTVNVNASNILNEQSIICPADTTILCHESYEPAQTGFAVLESCLPPDFYNITYNDIRSNSYCNGDQIAFTVNRLWKVTTNTGEEETCQQTINANLVNIGDIIFPPSYDSTDLPPLICSQTASYDMLADTSLTGIPIVNGRSPATLACNINIIFTDEVINVCGEHYKIKRKWQVFDFCTDEILTHDQIIIIKDEEPPVFSVPSLIPVSNQSDCGQEVNLPAIQLTQECSPYQVEIWSPWDTLHSDGGVLEVPVNLGLWDIVYVATDGCGNISTDTVQIIFNGDVIAACPDNATISCSFYQNELENALDTGGLEVLQQFGNPILNANCEALEVVESAVVNMDTCFEGNIIRTMTVTANGQSHTCEQNIEVVKVSDFIVEFPADITIQCSTTPPNFGEPEIFGADCENMNVSYTDQVFNVVQDACYKIIRTWVVSNHCVSGDSLDNEVIEKSENQLGLPYPLCDLDGDGDCDNRTFRDSWTNTSMPGFDEAQTATGFDTDPDADPWDGYLVYEQVIKVTDTVDPEFTACNPTLLCADDNTCTIDLTLPTPAVDDCTIVDITSQIRIGGVWKDGAGVHQDLPVGEYLVRYIAQDQCNNQSSCETNILVRDCVLPTANCILPTTIELPPSGALTLFASELNDGSFDNCPGNLRYSFTVNINDKTRIFNCDSVGIRTLKMYVTDANGNQSVCSTEIYFTSSPIFPCEPPDAFPIPGHVVTPENEGIADVGIPNQNGITYTNGNGVYHFPYEDVPGTLTPSRNFDPSNGVTTYDIVLLTRHVLGSQPLNSPYKIIAADANHSNTVTTFDAVVIRQLVLNITTGFPNNTSWRFVPKNYVFPNPNNPFNPPFPESIAVDLNAVPGDLDFVGIKIGDLNSSAETDFAGGNDDRHFKENWSIQMDNKQYSSGETFNIPVYFENIPIYGCQFALAFDTKQLEMLELAPGFVGSENFNQNAANLGVLKMSWNSQQPFNSDGKPAFTLVFKAKTSGSLQDILLLDEIEMPAEAYSGKLELLYPQLLFISETPGETRTLFYPARPNPFSDNTTLSFKLPANGLVHLTCTDARGRLVLSHRKFYEKGHQAFQILSSELPGTGLYIFTIDTDWGKWHSKLVLN